MFNKPSEILELHRKVGHPNFQILFHTAHKGSVSAVHLIDSDGTLHHNETSMRRPFDAGFIDFRVLAPKLLDLPEVEWWCIDLSLLPGSWDLIEPSREFVLELLNEKVAA